MFVASAQLLHIPDGFLSITIATIAWLLSGCALFLAMRRGQVQLDERLIPLAGIMAAFIFAGQMINFPVATGTSGHLIGATLAAIVLGPWLGILVMTAVISLQALMFQDGGLVAMGANILVMGVVPALVGYGLYRVVARRHQRLRLAVAAAAAWLSIMAAALATALMLGFSGTVSFRLVVPAMLGVHAFIGVGEALISVAALSFVFRARPALVEHSAEAGGRGWIVAGFALSLLVAVLSPLASRFPDGLEWVAGRYGFLQQAQAAPFALFPDYTVSLIGKGALSTIFAGILGAVVVALFTYLAVRLIRRSATGEAER